MSEPPTSHSQAKFMMIAAWATALALLTLIAGDWEDNQRNPNQNPASYAENGVREVTLLANRASHYLVNGEINDHGVTFLLDTGATHVALSRKLADELKLKRLQTGYAQTANGVTQVQFTRLDSVEIGPIRLTDVSASIGSALPDDTVLLGMSALKHLELVQANNQLVLRQNTP